MESGKITDEQITASSSFYDGHWLPHQARLNYEENGWTPNEDSNREYIQVSPPLGPQVHDAARVSSLSITSHVR